VTQETPPAPLAARLRQAIEDAGISQRELARRVVARIAPDASETRVENERRQILKYLAGKHAPEPERADLYAELLGKPPGYFTEPEARRLMIDQLGDIVVGIDTILAILEARLPERMLRPIEAAEAVVRQLDAGERLPAEELAHLADQMDETSRLCARLAARLREADVDEGSGS